MVAITLNTGESVSIAFANTDGEFLIAYDTPQYPEQLVVKETAGLPGSVVGAASAVLYHEDWRAFQPPVGDLADDELVAAPVGLQHHGWFCDASGEVRHTDMVRCLVRELPDNERVVVTLDSKDFETGEFTFYESLAEMDALMGINRVLNIL